MKSNNKKVTLFLTRLTVHKKLCLEYMRQSIQKWTKWNLWKIAFKKLEVSRPYDFKFFKGSLPQILFGPFLNTLPQIKLAIGKETTHVNRQYSFIKPVQECVTFIWKQNNQITIWRKKHLEQISSALMQIQIPLHQIKKFLF